MTAALYVATKASTLGTKPATRVDTMARGLSWLTRLFHSRAAAIDIIAGRIGC